MSGDDRVIVLVDEARRAEILDGLLRASITAEFAAGWAERRAESHRPVSFAPPTDVVVPEVQLASLHDFLGLD